jgi:NADH dehydrogenase/NADH:ubiquinone oxidoreductase subunit G
VGVLVILSAVGAALNVVPFFFYDLTETKQKAIIRILQIRAMFEDYGNGVLTDADMKSAMEIIRGAKERFAAGAPDPGALKKNGAAKAEIKEAAAAREEYEIAVSVLEELDRFSTPFEQARLRRAGEIAAAGVQNIPNVSTALLAEAKALPNDTKENRAIRKDAVSGARLALRCKKAAAKYYPNGIAPFDEVRLNRLYADEQRLTEKKAALLREKGGKAQTAEISAELGRIAAEIKAMHAEYGRYMESTKVFHDAKKLIAQAENYARFGELDQRYTALREDLPADAE